MDAEERTCERDAANEWNEVDRDREPDRVRNS